MDSYIHNHFSNKEQLGQDGEVKCMGDGLSTSTLSFSFSSRSLWLMIVFETCPFEDFILSNWWNVIISIIRDTSILNMDWVLNMDWYIETSLLWTVHMNQ